METISRSHVQARHNLRPELLELFIVSCDIHCALSDNLRLYDIEFFTTPCKLLRPTDCSYAPLANVIVRQRTQQESKTQGMHILLHDTSQGYGDFSDTLHSVGPGWLWHNISQRGKETSSGVLLDCLRSATHPRDCSIPLRYHYSQVIELQYGIDI